MPHAQKYTKELLEPLVKNSRSMKQLLEKLELKYSGGNHFYIKKIIKSLNIDYCHFTGQGWSKNITRGFKRPIEDYLSNRFDINSDALKKRLIKESIFEAKCHHCNNHTWLNEPIPLELHHKDHNHKNNNLDNLTIVCSNCHSYIHRHMPK